MSNDVVIPMPSTVIGRQGSWKQGELYELLCLMTIGACLWLVGTQFGVFDTSLFRDPSQSLRLGDAKRLHGRRLVRRRGS